MLPMSDENRWNNLSSRSKQVLSSMPPGKDAIESLCPQENAHPAGQHRLSSQSTSLIVLAGQELPLSPTSTLSRTSRRSSSRRSSTRFSPPPASVLASAADSDSDPSYCPSYAPSSSPPYSPLPSPSTPPAPPPPRAYPASTTHLPSACPPEDNALADPLPAIYLSKERTSTVLSKEDRSIMSKPSERMSNGLLDKVLAKSLISGVNAQVIDSSYAYTLVSIGGELDNRLFADPDCMYLVPFCDDTHWVLTVFLGAGTPNARVLLLNSISGNELGGLVTQFVALVCGADTEIIRPRVPQQAAGSEDCGFFVAYYACELMLQHQTVVQCSRAQLEADQIWEDVFDAHDAVIDVRDYVRKIAYGLILSDVDKLKRQRLPERKASRPKRQETGERAELLALVVDDPYPRQCEDFYGVCHSTEHVADLFGTLSKPAAPNLQMSSQYFETPNLEYLREVLVYVLLSVCSRKTLTDGMQTACLGMPSSHNLPRWIALNGEVCSVKYRLDGAYYSGRLLHLAAPVNDRMVEEHIQISHQCHNFWCHNPLHVVLESGPENVSRNRCGPDCCEHDPPCVIDGGDYANRKWDPFHTRAEALAARQPLEVCDEVFPPCRPEPVDLEADSDVLSGTDLVAKVKYALYLLCARGAELDAEGRKMDCWMPPTTRWAPKWMTTSPLGVCARYYHQGEVEYEEVRRLLFFGTHEFEYGDLEDVSHLCHHTHCHNPEHIVLESSADNVQRNFCAPQWCEHTPKCVMMGSVSFKSFKKLALWNITPESKSFDCPVCDMNFTNPGSFMNHALTHENERHYLCPICGASFKQKVGLTAHIVRHSDERPWVCSECPATFKHSCNFHQHMRDVHSELVWKECPECKNCFKRHDLYENHLKIHEKTFEWHICDVCGNKLYNKTSLNKHLKTHDIVICPVCGREMSATRTTSHLRAHLPGYLECPDCGDGLKGERTLARHRETHRTTLVCPWEGCEATFGSRPGLKMHEIVKHLKVEYRCRDCGRRYATKSGLTRHKCRADTRTPAQPEAEAEVTVQCEECKREVLQKFFESHMKVHTEEYHECPHCGYGLKTKKTFNAHVLAHERPTGHKCRVEGCSEGFSNHKARSGHEQKAHADVMLKCDDCAKLYLTEADLAKHKCHPK